jgi:hypothetical protein
MLTSPIRDARRRTLVGQTGNARVSQVEAARVLSRVPPRRAP